MSPSTKVANFVLHIRKSQTPKKQKHNQCMKNKILSSKSALLSKIKIRDKYEINFIWQNPLLPDIFLNLSK